MEDQVLAYKRRLESFPADRAAFEAVSRVCEDGSDWQALSRLIETRLSAVPDAPDALALRLQLAKVYLDRLNDPTRASRQYERVLSLEPHNVEAMDAMLPFLEERGAWADVARMLAQRIDTAATADVAAQLAERIGDLQAERLNRPVDAVTSYVRAFDMDQSRTGALEKARHICMETGNAVRAGQLLERQVAALGDEGLAAEHLEIGESLVREPWHRELARRLLERARDLGEKDGAVAALAEIDEQPKAWKETARGLRALAVETREKRRAATAYLRIAQLHAFYGENPQKVHDNLERVFLLYPGNTAALEFLERFHGEKEDWAGLATGYEHIAQTVKDRSVAAAVRVRLARVQSRRLNDAELALGNYRRALDIDPAHPEAASALVEVLLARQLWTEAAAVLEARLSSVGDRDEQARLRFQLADLYLGQADDAERGRQHLEALLGADPMSRTRAGRALEPIYTQIEAWKSLGKALESQLEGPLPPSDRRHLLERLSELYVGHLDRPVDAAKAAARILALDPTIKKSATRLRELASAAGDLTFYARGLAVAADLVEDRERRHELLSLLAALEVKELDDPKTAADIYRQILDEDPGHREATEGLEQSLTASGSVEELTDALVAKASKETDPQKRRDVLLQLGRQREEAQGQPAEARAIYEQLLETNADDPEVLGRLTEVLSVLQDWDALPSNLQARIALTAPQERPRLEVRLAGVHRRRGDDAAAARLYRKVFDEGLREPGIIAALEELMRSGVESAYLAESLAPFYAETEDWGRHFDALRYVIDGLEDPSAKIERWKQAAAVQETHLADKRQALAAYVSAQQLAPGDEALLVEVRRLAGETGAWTEYEGALNDAIAGKGLTADRVTLIRMRLAELRENELGDPDGAAQAYLEVMDQSDEADPSHASALMALVRMARGGERWENLEEALSRLVVLPSQAGSRTEVLLELGQVRLEHRDKPEQAAENLEAALEAGAPEEVARPLLNDALEKSGRSEELARSLERSVEMAQASGDTDLASRLKLRRANLLAEGLGQTASAVPAYRAVLEERPGDPDALAALEKLLDDPDNKLEASRALAPAYERSHEYAKLTDVLRLDAEAATSGAARALLLMRVASVQERDLHQKGDAFDTLAQVMEFEPSADVAKDLIRLAEEADASARVPAVIGAGAAAATGETAVLLHRIAAGWATERLDDKESALVHNEAILAAVPDDKDALGALRGLYRATERWAQLIEVCEQLATKESELAEKIRLLRETGRINEERLEDLAAAALAHRAVLDLDPKDAESARIVDRLYQNLEQWDDLVWVLELQRGLVEEGERHRDLSFRIAELYRNRLGREEEALELYKGVLSGGAHPPSRGALEMIVEGGGDLGRRSAEVLDPYLLSVGEHRARIDIREARLARATSDRLGDEERATLQSDIRRIYEKDLHAPEMAFMVACRQLPTGVDFDAVRDDAERLAGQLGSLDDLCEIYDDIAEDLPDEDPRKVDLLRRAASFHVQSASVDDAIVAWKKVQALAPQDRDVLDQLEALFNTKADSTGNIEIYRSKVDLAESDEERTHARLELAALFEKTGSDTQAIDAYELVAAELERFPAPGKQALLALDRLYDKAERFQDLSRVLASILKLLGDHPARYPYMVRLGALFEKHDAHPARALEIYEAVLESVGIPEPGDDGAGQSEANTVIGGLERLMQLDEARVRCALLLEPVYRTRGETRKLIEVLEAKLAETRGPAARLTLFREIAASYEDKLGQKPLAFMVWCRAFSEAPDDPDVRAALEAAATQTGGWEELVGVYEETLEDFGEDEARIEDRLQLHRRVAQVYEGDLGQPGRAVAHRRTVAKLDESVDSLEALARLLQTTEGQQELASVYGRLVRRVRKPQRQVELWLKIAGLLDTVVGDKAGAVFAYREVMKMWGEGEPDREVLTQLGRLLSGLERWEELCEILDIEARLASAANDKPSEAEWRYRLGRVQQTRLGDPVAATGSFAQVLEANPHHPETLAALEELLAAGPQSKGADREAAGKAAAILDPRYEAAGEGNKRVSALEMLAAVADSPERRSQLLSDVARQYAESAENPEMAFLAASRSLTADPSNMSIMDQIHALAQRAELEEEEAELLSGLVDEIRQNDEVSAFYRRRLGELYSDAGEVEDAIKHYKVLLRIVPTDAEGLDRLARLTRLDGDYKTYIEVLRRQLDVVNTEEDRVRVLRQIGTILEDPIGDAVGALQAYRTLLESAPDDRAALQRMDHLCVVGERWTDLDEILRNEARLAGEAGEISAQVDFYFRLAEVKEERLVDPEGAIPLFRELLRLQPGHQDTIARLEEILEQNADRIDVAQILEDVYRTNENWLRLLAMLDVRAAHEPEVEARQAVLWEMHEVQEKHLGSPEMAFILLCRAFNESPASKKVREGLERLAELTEQHEELAAVYEDALEQIGVPEVVAEMSLTVARIYDEALDDPDQAMQYYEQVRKVEPDNIKALQALDRLYRKKEDWHDLAENLERQAALAEGTEEKAAILFRLGQLLGDKMQTTDRAVAVYEELLELEPSHMAALRSLEHLYEVGEAWPKLAANIEQQLERAGDDQGRERLTGRLADVLGKQMGEHERAIALWKKVLELNKRSEAAQAALEDLYERSSQWEELAAHLRLRLERTIDPREITRLNDRLGWVMGSKLGQAADAIESFKAVLERDPRNLRALAALRDIHHSQENWEDLVVILKRLAPLQETPAGVKEVRFRLAEVLGRRLQKRDEAIEAARRFLDIEPHDPEELGRLEELVRELKALSVAVQVMELRQRAIAEQMSELVAQEVLPENEEAHQASVEEVRARRVVLLFAIAKAHAEELHRAEGGAAALEEVLQVDAGNREAYRQLRGLYETAGRWREMVTLLDHFLNQVEDQGERRGLQVEIAGLHEVRLGQKEMAFLALGRAFSDSPGDEPIELELFRLAEDTESWEEMGVILEDIADDQEPSALKSHLFLRLAEVHDKHLDDPEEAEDSIRKVLAFDPGSQAALGALADLFVSRGQATDLVVALEQKLEATGDPEEQKQVLAKIASVFETDVGDVEEAIATWRRVLELDGADATAIDALARIYENQEKWEELTATLRRAVDSAQTPSARADLMRRIGALHEERLEDDEGAIKAYQGGLEYDSAHAPSLSALEQMFTRLERWVELLQTYEAEIEVTAEDSEKVRLLLKVSALHEDQFDHGENALNAFDRVRAIEPDNMTALKGQVRTLRSLETWERLIDSLGHLISLTPEQDEAVQLHIEQGQVWHDQLKKVDKAEQIFNHAIEMAPESRIALRALGDLYEKSGNWNLALDMMTREARIASMADDAVELYHRMGKIHEDMLLDASAARTNYEQSLDIDPSYLPAIQSLKDLSEVEKDWESFIEALIQEAKHTGDLALKTRLLHQIGVFYRDEREDDDSALRYFEEALQKTEEDLESAEMAATLYLARQNWVRGEELLRIVCRVNEAQQLDQKALCPWWYKLGYVREKLNNTEEALEAFRRAYECDATYLPALEGLGAALVSTSRWDEALKIYQAILIHHREAVTDLEVVEYHWQIGDINQNLEQPDRAVRSFEKALEIDSGHEPSLTGIIRLLEEQEEWEDALDYRQRLLDSLDEDQRYELYLAIGQTSWKKISDPYQAIDAYQGAHRLLPDEVAPMESLLVLFRETRQSAKAVEMLEELLAHPEIQKDPGKSRRYHATLAEVYRDEIKDPDRAVEHFNAALDIDYTYAAAFASIEEMLVHQKKWTDLEQNYVRMIQRIPKNAKTHAARMGLWKTLGEFYRKVLRNLDGAIAAYQVVCKGDKDDADAIETYAALLADKKGAEKQAVEAFHQALKVTSEPARVARALLRLYSAQGNYDKAFNVASVITHLLGNAEPEEQEVYDRLKPYARDQASHSLTDHLWEQALYHEKLRGPVADILAIVYEQAGSELGETPRALGLHERKDRVDIGSSMLYFANMYKYVGRALGMEDVALYKQAELGEGLAVANTWPVSLIASEEMLNRSKKRRLWFTIGKALAFTRAELALGRVHSLETLDLILQAAATLVNPRFRVTADPAEVQKLQKRLERAISPEAREALGRVVRGWKPDRAVADLRAYAEGVEHTANRAGILLSGDVEAARSCLMEDRGGAARLPLRSKVRELVMFCLSEEYFQLREALGIDIQIET